MEEVSVICSIPLSGGAMEMEVDPKLDVQSLKWVSANYGTVQLPLAELPQCAAHINSGWNTCRAALTLGYQGNILGQWNILFFFFFEPNSQIYIHYR